MLVEIRRFANMSISLRPIAINIHGQIDTDVSGLAMHERKGGDLLFCTMGSDQKRKEKKRKEKKRKERVRKMREVGEKRSEENR